MNITLWSLLALMLLIALVIVIPPLWRRSGERALSRRATNIRIYRERMAELELERANGRLDATQMKSQADELGRRLLLESEQDPPADTPNPDRTRPWMMTGVLLLAVPAIALGLYWSAGTWRTPTDAPDLPFLAQRLEQRVAEYPQDSQAWMLLGRARRAMAENAAAAEAFKQANTLAQEPEVAVLLQEVEVSTLAANGDLTGRPRTLLQQVLKREPENIEALWLSGLAARQSGQTSAAREFWQRLLRLEIPAEFAATVRTQLSKLPAN